MNERIEELMSIICEGQNSIQREEVENYINNLQSKIDKAIELKHNWQNIKENATMVFDNNSLIEFMNNLENILKEDK